jgi:hypothetical protein
MKAALSWPDVERITRGQLGRTMRAPCPFCSASRRKSRAPVFAVWRDDPDFARFNCAHCGAHGYVRSGLASRPMRSSASSDEVALARFAAAEKQRRIASALELWGARESFCGSPAETYLRVSRGIGDWLDQFTHIDEVLGFHPRCPIERERLPAMLALVRDIQTDRPIGIHRTALTDEPSPRRIKKLSLGPVAGGAIKLTPGDEVFGDLLIGEGVETVLSASLLFHMQPAWSVISRSGIAKFPALPGMKSITVAVDNDQSGDGPRDAETMSERLSAEGIKVIRKRPRHHKDFNDVVRNRATQ